MKFIYIVAATIVALSAVSCKKETEKIVEVVENNEAKDLTKVKTIEENGLSVEIFTASGKFVTGYNEIFYRVKDLSLNAYVNNATLTAKPMMFMVGMSHGCPTISVEKLTARPNMYKGGVVFTMASNEQEYWELGVDVNQNGTVKSVNSRVVVEASPKRNVSSFLADDGKRYTVAMVQPTKPITGINTISAYIFERVNGSTYPIVNGYKLEFDPRMPGMGNHSSPNNVHMTQTSANGLYEGKVSLTMTGYWKINLRLLDDAGNVLKGEEVTTANPSSSIFFEIEF